MCGGDSEIPAELKDFILDFDGPHPFTANPLTSKDEFLKEAYEYITEEVDQFHFAQPQFSPPKGQFEFTVDFCFPDSPGFTSSSSSEYSSTQSFASPPEYQNYPSGSQSRMLSPPNFAPNSSEFSEFFPRPEMSAPSIQNGYYQMNENYENYNQNIAPSPLPSAPVQYYLLPQNNSGFEEERKVFGSLENRNMAKKNHQKTKTKDFVCSNCQTRETSLWRWNVNGLRECNACNIFEARNGQKRPIELRKDKILPRKRNPRGPQPAATHTKEANNVLNLFKY